MSRKCPLSTAELEIVCHMDPALPLIPNSAHGDRRFVDLFSPRFLHDHGADTVARYWRDLLTRTVRARLAPCYRDEKRGLNYNGVAVTWGKRRPGETPVDYIARQVEKALKIERRRRDPASARHTSDGRGAIHIDATSTGDDPRPDNVVSCHILTDAPFPAP